MNREEVLEKAHEAVKLFIRASHLMSDAYENTETAEDNDLLEDVFGRAQVNDTFNLSFDEMGFGLGLWLDELEIEIEKLKSTETEGQ